MNGWFADDWDPGRDGSASSDDGPFDLDDALVDQLLDATDAESVPAAYRPLAHLLVAVRAPATRAELAGETEAVARFRATRMTQATLTWSCHPRRLRRRTTALVIAATLTFVSATGAAAATGRLPDDVQDMASELLSKLGINVPGSRRDTPPSRPEPADDGRRALSVPAASSTSGEAGSGGTDSGLVAQASAARTRSTLVVIPAPPDPLGEGVAATPVPVPEEPPPVEPIEGTATEPQPASPGTPASPPPHAPSGPPSTAPASPPPPEPNGPPSGEPSDQAPSIANAPPSWAPAGPPASVPVGPPPHAPAGPPASVPVGPPPHAPAGPPSSLPADPPGQPG